MRLRGPVLYMVGILALVPGFATPGALAEEKPLQVGVILARSGPEMAAGRTIEQAVRLAAEQYSVESGRTVELKEIPSEMPWGGQTTALVESVFDEGVRALIGAPGFASGHVTGQVVTRLKGEVLFLAASVDSSLTQIGVPWIFQAVAREQRHEGLLSRKLEEALREENFPGVDQNRARGFVRLYRARFQSEPLLLSAFVYDSSRALLDSLGSCDGSMECARLKLLEGDHLGLLGPWRFDSLGNYTFLSVGRREAISSPHPSSAENPSRQKQ